LKSQLFMGFVVLQGAYEQIALAADNHAQPAQNLPLGAGFLWR
jgi:hypothetical protein